MIERAPKVVLGEPGIMSCLLLEKGSAELLARISYRRHAQSFGPLRARTWKCLGRLAL